MRTTCSMIFAMSMAAGASASIDYSLEDVDVFGTGLTTIGTVETEAAGLQLESIDLSGAQLVTYDNTGIPNFADEVILGLELADSSGASVLYYFFPFPGDDSWGTFGPWISPSTCLARASTCLPVVCWPRLPRASGTTAVGTPPGRGPKES